MLAAVIVWALSMLLGARAVLASTLVVAVVAGLLTVSAAGRRAPFGDQWFQVEPNGFEAVQPGDAVLVDGQYPSTFLLAGQPTDGVGMWQKDFHRHLCSAG